MHWCTAAGNQSTPLHPTPHRPGHHGGLHNSPASVDCHAQHLLTFQGFGRLGNQMFRYASSYGIARHNNRRLVLPSSRHELRAIFLLAGDSLVCSAEVGVNVSDGTWQSVGGGSYGGAVYDDSLLHLPPSHNIILHGYLLSWRYFSAFVDDLREHFLFRPSILRAARAMLHTSLRTLLLARLHPCLHNQVSYIQQ